MNKFPARCLSSSVGPVTGERGTGCGKNRWRPGDLQIHCIHTGCGESLFLIFPDSTTMLLDCGDAAPRNNPADDIVPAFPDASRSPGEWVAEYVMGVNPAEDPSWVDWLVVSHYHSDHVGWLSGTDSGHPNGLAAAARTLHFRRAVDRGRPGTEARAPEPLVAELALLERLYDDLGQRDGLVRERLEVGLRDQIRPIHGDVPGFTIFNLCANGLVADERTGEVKDFCDGKTGYSENAMSLGFIIRHGDFSLYTAGDFSGHVRDASTGAEADLEEMLAPVVPPVTAAKINHHGHYSMPSALVTALRPMVWFGSTWTLRHFVPPVMERLADRSLYPGERMICPPFLPAAHVDEARDSGAEWLRDVPPSAFDGGHVVLTVPQGGKTFDVEYRYYRR